MKNKWTCIQVRYRAYKIALLDTGSDITIAGRDVADRCGWQVKSHDMAPITQANGENLDIEGVATVAIKFNGASTEMDVIITRDLSGLILGVDWMKKQGLWTWD